MRVTALAALAAIIAGSAARAAPLDEAACNGLKAERTALIEKGVEKDMAQGPAWAKANLPPERLKEIARLIDVGEQLAFRCRPREAERQLHGKPSTIALPVRKKTAAEPKAESAAVPLRSTTP